MLNVKVDKSKQKLPKYNNITIMDQSVAGLNLILDPEDIWKIEQ